VTILFHCPLCKNGHEAACKEIERLRSENAALKDKLTASFAEQVLKEIAVLKETLNKLNLNVLRCTCGGSGPHSVHE